MYYIHIYIYTYTTFFLAIRAFLFFVFNDSVPCFFIYLIFFVYRRLYFLKCITCAASEMPSSDLHLENVYLLFLRYVESVVYWLFCHCWPGKRDLLPKCTWDWLVCSHTVDSGHCWLATIINNGTWAALKALLNFHFFVPLSDDCLVSLRVSPATMQKH